MSNRDLEATKCLLRHLSISVLFVTGIELAIKWRGRSDEQALPESDFMDCQNLLEWTKQVNSGPLEDRDNAELVRGSIDQL